MGYPAYGNGSGVGGGVGFIAALLLAGFGGGAELKGEKDAGEVTLFTGAAAHRILEEQ